MIGRSESCVQTFFKFWGLELSVMWPSSCSNWPAGCHRSGRCPCRRWCGCRWCWGCARGSFGRGWSWRWWSGRGTSAATSPRLSRSRRPGWRYLRKTHDGNISCEQHCQVNLGMISKYEVRLQKADTMAESLAFSAPLKINWQGGSFNL